MVPASGISPCRFLVAKAIASFLPDFGACDSWRGMAQPTGIAASQLAYVNRVHRLEPTQPWLTEFSWPRALAEIDIATQRPSRRGTRKQTPHAEGPTPPVRRVPRCNGARLRPTRCALGQPPNMHEPLCLPCCGPTSSATSMAPAAVASRWTDAPRSGLRAGRAPNRPRSKAFSCVRGNACVQWKLRCRSPMLPVPVTRDDRERQFANPARWGCWCRAVRSCKRAGGVFEEAGVVP